MNKATLAVELKRAEYAAARRVEAMTRAPGGISVDRAVAVIGGELEVVVGETLRDYPAGSNAHKRAGEVAREDPTGVGERLVAELR